MTDDAHATADCAGCEWERQPQAFRWFPEMGRPLFADRRNLTDPATEEPTRRAS